MKVAFRKILVWLTHGNINYLGFLVGRFYSNILKFLGINLDHKMCECGILVRSALVRLFLIALKLL